MKRIAVLGMGAMGSGIAIELIKTGKEVVAIDEKFKDKKSLEETQEKFWRQLFNAKAKDPDKKNLLFYKSKEEAERAFSKVIWLAKDDESLKAYLPNCDAAIEAVFENENIKKALFKELEALMLKNAAIFTNTSTIQIGRLANGMKNPKRLIGLHFFNPVEVMPPVEAILQRSVLHDNDLDLEKATVKMAHATGKQIFWAPDLPGFIANRLLIKIVVAYDRKIRAGADFRKIDEAFTTGAWVNHLDAREIVEEMLNAARNLISIDKGPELLGMSGENFKENVDMLMKLGTAMPKGPYEIISLMDSGKDPEMKFEMGPAALIDHVGIDVAVDCVRSLTHQEPDGGWEEPEFLKAMLKSGNLGRKSGKGFYKYGSRVEKEELAEGIVKISFGDGHGNFLSLDLVKKLTETFKSLKNENLHAILLTGLGENFSVGANIKEFPSCLRSEGNAKHAINTFSALMDAIADCKAPVIAYVRGRCYGGGWETVMACDFGVAEEESEFRLPEVGLGILPGAGGTQRLPRLVGLRRALGVILTTKPVRAEKPWVDLVVSKGDATENSRMLYWTNMILAALKARGDSPKRKFGALKYSWMNYILVNWWWVKLCTGRLARKAPASASLALGAIWNGNCKALLSGLTSDEWNAIIAAFKTSDAEEGIRAFMEKRKPHFQGK